MNNKVNKLNSSDNAIKSTAMTRAALKEAKKREKAQKKAEFRKNHEALVRYINNLDVSDKVNYHLHIKSLAADPDRVRKLTKHYKNKEYRRIKKLTKHYKNKEYRRIKKRYSYYFK